MTCYGLNNLMRQDLVNPNQSLTCGLNQDYGSQGFLQALLNGTYSGCGYYGNSGYYNPTYTSYFPGQMNFGFNAGASVANYFCSLGNMIVTSISNNRKENASITVDQDLEDINKKIKPLMTDLGITEDDIETKPTDDGEIEVTINKSWVSPYTEKIKQAKALVKTYTAEVNKLTNPSDGSIIEGKGEDYEKYSNALIAAQEKLSELQAEETKKIEELKSLILNRIGAENYDKELVLTKLNGEAPKDSKYSNLIESYFDNSTGAIKAEADPTPKDVQTLFAFYINTDPSKKDEVAQKIHKLYQELGPGEQTPSLQLSYKILKGLHDFDMA
ncbi:hypothetical protein IKB17_01255 [bacterium]|nr:hypothetical protein [bacterium]